MPGMEMTGAQLTIVAVEVGDGDAVITATGEDANGNPVTVTFTAVDDIPVEGSMMDFRARRRSGL